MRSWFAVWGNILLVAGYVIWNVIFNNGLRFDPYPFLLLCTALTALSYLQNPIILTMQRVAEEAQARQEALMRQQIDLMARHLLYQLHQTEAMHAILTRTPGIDRSADNAPEGSGIPGDI
jgi:uncharacterized membrane protein